MAFRPLPHMLDPLSVLANEYAYAAECQMATLSGFFDRKRQAKHEVERQKSICLSMLLVCQQHRALIAWERGRGSEYGRVKEVLDDPQGLPGSLDAWIETQK